MSNRAWVTLATNDSYGLGALVLAHSLRRAGSTHPAVVLITPAVTDAMRDRLRAVFAEVVIVDVLDSRDAAHLALLQRPELGITFTKIHCWSLTQYEKCVFLDADALVVQNCDELFEREELSAAPDVGWPDCFNSGVFVYTPSSETFDKLIKFAQERGSFDGGDQGLLNAFFSDWAHGDINKHLPFLYNVTSAAFYSYIPALKHYGQNLKIIHFIGTTKPWLQRFNWESRSVEAPDHLRDFLQLWWDLFLGQVHSQLDTAMTGVAGNLARVVPGAVGPQRDAVDELTRRQGWESGNIDYMGADSFENIWAKISQTLSQPRTSPPKQTKEPTPPPKEASSLPKEPTPPPKLPTPPLKEPSPPKQPEPEPAIEAKEAIPVSAATVSEAETFPAEAPATFEASAPLEPPKEAAVEELVQAETVKLAESAPAPVATESAAVPAVAELAPAAPAAESVPVALAVEPSSAAPAAVLALAAPAAKSEPKRPAAASEKTETSVPKTPPATPKSTSEASTPITETPPKLHEPAPKETIKVAEIPSEASKATTPPKLTELSTAASDSPPLANTPAKEENPTVPAAKCPNRACNLM